MEMPAPGWYQDPTGRHEYRYWTGALWSRHVADDGEKSVERIAAPTEAIENGFAYSSFDDDAPPPRRRRRRVALALLLVVLLAGGAGAGVMYVMEEDESEPDPDAIAEPLDPLVATLTAYVENRSGGQVATGDAECMAQSIVDTIGEPRLVEAGVDTGADPLTALTADEVRNGLPVVFTCLDDESLLAFMSATFNPSALASLSVPNADCLLDGWLNAFGRDKLVELFSLWAARQGNQLAAALSAEQLGTLSAVIAQCQAATPASPPPSSP